MLRLMFQAIFLAFALIANLYMTGDASAELVCGTLLAICCTAVGEYARLSVWKLPYCWCWTAVPASCLHGARWCRSPHTTQPCCLQPHMAPTGNTLFNVSKHQDRTTSCRESYRLSCEGRGSLLPWRRYFVATVQVRTKTLQ